jgi:WD40 repeat protein
MRSLLGRFSSLVATVCLSSVIVCNFTVVFAQDLSGQSSPGPPAIISQAGHSGGVDTIAFSPDGRWLASGGIDSILRIWNLTTGQVVRTLGGQGGEISSLAFSPDGHRVALSVRATYLGWPMRSEGMHIPAGNEVRVWDVVKGELVWKATYPHEVHSLALSSDGRLLASVGLDKRVRIWDAATGSQLRSLAAGARGWMECVAFSADGGVIAAAGPRRIRIWEVANGQSVRTLPGHKGGTLSLVFSPDGRHLASGGLDGSIKVWDVATWNEKRSLPVHSPVYSVNFSPDGRLLASGNADGTVNTWRTENWNSVLRLKVAFGRVSSVAFDPSSQSLATASVDIQFWDVLTGTKLQTFSAIDWGVLGAFMSPDGNLLVSQSSHFATVWESSSGMVVARLSDHGKGLSSMAFSSDSKLLAIAEWDKTIRLWEVGRRQLVRTLPQSGYSSNLLAFCPNTHLLASADSDNNIRLWDIDFGRQLQILRGHRSEIYTLAFSPNGRILVSSAGQMPGVRVLDYYIPERDTSVRIWDVSTGRQIRMLDPIHHYLKLGRFLAPDPRLFAPRLYFPSKVPCTVCRRNLAFNRDGRWLASSLGDTVQVWETATWREVRHWTVTGTEWMGITWSPDSKSIAAGSKVGSIALWNFGNNKQWPTFRGSETQITSLNFNVNGKLLISSSYDGTSRIFDAATGVLQATLVSTGRPDDWLAIAPDGLFDGSAAGWKQILWHFNNNTFDVAPVEIFFREFYYPGLLADILAGRHPKPTSDIVNIDRRQPVVELLRTDQATPDQPLESRTIKLRLQVSEAQSDDQHKDGSGARDVRLFRNGALVKVWRGDLQLDSQGHAHLEMELPIVAGENKFTAYAFSRSDIKSSDATLTVTGAGALKRDGIGYILAVGVNEYAKKGFELKYAVADVQEFASAFSEQQLKLQNYAALKTTYLLNSDATKANVLAALERLAGASADELTPAQQKLFADLAPAQPEDGVFIYYAGHGYAHGQRFYLLPHDMVMPERGEDFAKPEAHTVSDLELGDVFEKIGAGRSVFVIDACRSGQALESEEKRRGPMNSKGLAQLAYEKGMYILTASQSYQSALESAELGGGHGFLTYALVEKGLKTSEAALDGQVELRHWLDYATQLVPQLQLASMQEAQKQGRRLVVVTGEDEESASPEQRTLQRPRVFYRREPEAQPFIVAIP